MIIAVVGVSDSYFPLHVFLERLGQAGIYVSIRDYRRISVVLAAEGQWTLTRLERVLSHLLVRDRDARLLFKHEFQAFFRTSADNDNEAQPIDVQRWRDEISQLLAGDVPLSDPQAATVAKASLLPDEAETKSSDDVSPDQRWQRWFHGRAKWLWLVFGVITSVVLAVFLSQTVFKPIEDSPPQTAPVADPIVTTEAITLSGKPPVSDTITVSVTKPSAPVVDRRIMPSLWLPLLLLASLVSVGLLAWWWTQLRPPPVRQKVFCDPGLPAQYFDDASVGGALLPWLDEAEADHLADQLHYVFTDQYTRELDVAASVQATSESGSVPVLRFKKRRDLQKILILTDQLTDQQGWHSLPDELMQALQARGVHLTLGRFNGSPERFVDQQGRVHHLEDWEEYRHHLFLLIFADTHQAEGLQDFPWNDWPDARLLTRQESRNWDFREQGLLAQGVTLLPADDEGLQQAWAESATQAVALESGRWEVEGQKPDETLGDFLQRALGSALPWAQALAHYPGAWSLAAAEHLRRVLCPEVPRLALQRLLSLPGTWVAGNSVVFAPEIQAVLRQGFLQRSPQAQTAIIHEWLGLMQAVEPQPETLAWALWRWKCIRLEWALDADKAAEAMHALVVSVPALSEAIREEITQGELTQGGLLSPPTTRKGQQHLLEVGDACGLKKSVVYAAANQYRRGGLLAGGLAAVFVGMGVWNMVVGAPPENPDPLAGQRIEVPVPHMIAIPAGQFRMGCEGEDNCEDDEKPVREVSIADFELSAYEVTVGQFRAFMEATGYQTTAEQEGSCWSYDSGGKWDNVKGNFWRKTGYAQTDNSPVSCVSWLDAQAYLTWLSEQTGEGWRLPTEAEWEYAARAGTTSAYSWGDDAPVCDRQAASGAQFGDCKEKAPLNVGSFKANAFGLYDVHGNVWEWVEDCWQDSYQDAPNDGSARSGCDAAASRVLRVLRVLRSGSWSNSPWNLRSANRLFHTPDARGNDVGFRAARTIKPLPLDGSGTPQQPAQAAPSGEVLQPEEQQPAVGSESATNVAVPTMVKIEGGEFMMGCDPQRDDVEGGCDNDEKPLHAVTVPTFWLAETEVTVAQYLACVDAGGCPEPEWREKGSDDHIDTGSDDHYKKLGDALTDPQHPIVGVSWHNAQSYVQWLSQETGQPYRLPTEAEWEYAARAGTDTAYSWGNAIGENNANCSGDRCGERFEYIAPVGSFAKSPFGLADMHGNVWEWTEDCWQDSYKDAPSDGSVRSGCDAAASRVLRGGSWGSAPGSLRSANRLNYPLYFSPVNRLYDVGFRAARTN